MYCKRTHRDRDRDVPGWLPLEGWICCIEGDRSVTLLPQCHLHHSSELNFHWCQLGCQSNHDTCPANSTLLVSPYGKIVILSLLLTKRSWPFDQLGLSVITIVIASIFVYLIGGTLADRIANTLTKRRGGVREPEVHLWNLIIPLFCGVFGSILFGIGGTYLSHVHWITILIGVGI
jgi:hypothetical protein